MFSHIQQNTETNKISYELHLKKISEIMFCTSKTKKKEHDTSLKQKFPVFVICFNSGKTEEEIAFSVDAFKCKWKAN